MNGGTKWKRAAGRALRALALLAVVGLVTAAAPAQAAPRLAALRIELWPEYDRAAVLVLLDGRLAEGTPLPATLALPIPAAAGQPHAAADYDANGNLLAADFTTTTADDDIIVTFSTNSLAFRLEYYDPALAVAGTERTYSFAWASPYAVDAATLRVQQPAGSSAFSMTPALTAEPASGDGLSYVSGSLGALAAGQAVPVTVSYTKPDNTLSYAVVGQGAQTPPVTASNNTPLILAAAGLGIMIIGGAIFFYTRRPPARKATKRATTRQRQRPAAQRAAAPASAPKPVAAPPAAASQFCTQCGTRRQPGDKFCRQCGATLNA